jgi:hypothetical protein
LPQHGQFWTTVIHGPIVPKLVIGNAVQMLTEVFDGDNWVLAGGNPSKQDKYSTLNVFGDMLITV